MSEATEPFIPRNYQLDLMNIAIRQNTIIYLPTGSGKTFIALLVLKRLGEPLQTCYNDGGKISVILVNSVPLVDQHTKYIRDHTVFSVGGFSGELNLDNWRQEQWEMQFNKYQVIIMTSQIMVNLINNRFIDISRVNLIIFDECHRGVDDHAMRQVMRNLQSTTELPRIVGLTATLLNANCKLNRVSEQVRSLETTFQSKVATVEGLEVVVGYSTNPTEKIKFSVVESTMEGQERVLKVLDDLMSTLKCFKPATDSNRLNLLMENLKPLEPEDILKRLKLLINDLIFHIKAMGIFGGYKACVAYMIQIERIKKHCPEPQLFLILNTALTTFGLSKCILLAYMKGYSEVEKIKQFSANKVIKLFEIMREYKISSQEDLCCLIFVQRRFTAKIIHHILETLGKVDPEFSGIKSNFIVGNANNPYNNTRENLYISKKNREVLDRFTNKEFNVLVSSNVLEEGVDIPKCTLVIKFDKSEDYRSYIQSKGRARHKSSFYYIIVEENDRQKYMEKYVEFQKIENHLNELLLGKNEDRTAPSEYEIRMMYNEYELKPYYVNGPNSARVDLVSAIPLLYRYCLSLSSDPYTICSPEPYLDDTDTRKGVRVVFFLPVVCPLLEPITGPFMPNKKMAKRAAALLACIKLHKIGELDDDLLPVKHTIKEEDIQYLFKHWPEIKEPNAGLKKTKRLHKKQVAACVTGPLLENEPLYLHIIELNPLYSQSEDFSKATVYDMFKTNLRFGFITPKPLQNLCKFPLFDSCGTLEVNIKINCKQISFTQVELLAMRQFHFLIFNDVLEILKEYLIFDNKGNNSETLLVVPIQDDGSNVTIDFKVIQENITLKSKSQPSGTERLNLDVSEETYLRKIVSPWYRTQTSMYLVTQICYHLNPKSPFPNDEFDSYISYYKDKHNVSTLNNEQPLIRVKGLSQRLNTFKPRGREGKRKKAQRYEELEEHLLPEFVVKQDFPACLWIQSLYLPCVLSRVMQLLKLQELQTKILQDIGLTLGQCPVLELDEDLLNYEPLDYGLVKVDKVKSIVSNDSRLAIESSSNLLTHQYNKDFSMKMIEEDYCWKNIEEPKDIEREINVTIMDIEYYENFISQTSSSESRLLKNESPKKSKDILAITYNKGFEEKNLSYLDIPFNGECPNLCEFYASLTTSEANDIVNLERLEILGDSFLKLMASLFIIFKYPKYSEGQCTTLKGRLVSNKNLLYLAQENNFGGIIKNRDLSPKEEWVPPCFAIPQELCTKICEQKISINTLFNCNVPCGEQILGVLSNITVADIEPEEVASDEASSYSSMCNFLNRQYVSDKTLADTVEALLGCFFLKGGIKGGIKFVEWIGIISKNENLENLINTTVINPIVNLSSRSENVTFHMPQWRELEKRLGYEFNNKAYLLQAITHGSYTPNRITQSYERLEFIGDAILDFLITCYIFENCGKLDPGKVTDLRSALVNNNTFASFTIRCGFHRFLLMINSKLQGHIDKFADYFARRDYVIDDEILILIEEEELCFAEQVDVPKILGDVFEALAGAVYLDSNKDLKTVWKVFYKIMWKEIQMFSENVPKNVLRRLYERHNVYPPKFSNTVQTENKKTMITLQFMHEGREKKVYGVGTNKNMAKRAAAKAALRFNNC